MQFGGDEKSTLFQKAWSLIIIIGARVVSSFQETG